MLIDEGRTGSPGEDDAPVFVECGERAEGEFHCADCAYGIAIRGVVPRCPMCGSEVWEAARTGPFAREHLDLFH